MNDMNQIPVIGEFLPVTMEGHVVQSKYVKAGYIVVENLAELNDLLNTSIYEDRDVLTEGTPVYVSEENKTYRYQSNFGFIYDPELLALENAINSSSSNLQSQINSLSNNLSFEIERAQQAEENLQSNINSVSENLSTIISNEVNRATNAESLLSNSISNEVNRAINSEEELQSQINTINNTTLPSINNSISDVQSNINQEVINRENAIKGLTFNNLPVSQSETIKSISQENGVIDVEKQSIQINTNQVSNLDESLSNIQSNINSVSENLSEDISELNSALNGEISSRQSLINNSNAAVIVEENQSTGETTVTINGNLNVSGTTTTVNAETIQSNNTLIVVNSDGSPLANNYAGIVALDGQVSGEPNKFTAIAAPIFDPTSETHNSLKIGTGVYDNSTGKFTFNSGSAQSLAIREPSSNFESGTIPSWDNSIYGFKNSGYTVENISTIENNITALNNDIISVNSNIGAAISRLNSTHSVSSDETISSINQVNGVITEVETQLIEIGEDQVAGLPLDLASKLNRAGDTAIGDYTFEGKFTHVNGVVSFEYNDGLAQKISRSATTYNGVSFNGVSFSGLGQRNGKFVVREELQQNGSSVASKELRADGLYVSEGSNSNYKKVGYSGDIQTVSNNLNSEINRATNAESSLNNSILNEINRATSAENTIQANLVQINNSIAIKNSSYTNPVLQEKHPDPTIWDGKDGYFYSVSTMDLWAVGSSKITRNIYRSKDLVNWENLGYEAIDSDSITALKAIYPQGDGTGGVYANFWAPHVIKIGNAYLMYGCLHLDDNNCAIVVLRSERPEGQFKYVRTLFKTTDTNVYPTYCYQVKSAIDPFVLVDLDGSVYMFYGGKYGIYRVQLTQDGLYIYNQLVTHVAGAIYENPTTSDPNRDTIFEGTYLYRNGNYWYLFVSSGRSISDNYKLRVGRSTTLTGDFEGYEGESLKDGDATVILESAPSDAFYGPGHMGNIFVDNNGGTYAFYHCHYQQDESHPETFENRYLMLQKMYWGFNSSSEPGDEGWPTFDENSLNGYPSYEGSVPVLPKETIKPLTIRDNIIRIEGPQDDLSTVYELASGVYYCDYLFTFTAALPAEIRSEYASTIYFNSQDNITPTITRANISWVGGAPTFNSGSNYMVIFTPDNTLTGYLGFYTEV